MGPTPSLLPCPLPRDRKGTRPKTATENIPRTLLAKNTTSCLAVAGTIVHPLDSGTPGGGQSQIPSAGWLGKLPRSLPPHCDSSCWEGPTGPGPGPRARAFAETSLVWGVSHTSQLYSPGTLSQCHFTEDRGSKNPDVKAKATPGTGSWEKSGHMVCFGSKGLPDLWVQWDFWNEGPTN